MTTAAATTPHRRVVTAVTALGRRHHYQIPFRHQKSIATTMKNEEPCLCYDCPPSPLPLKRSTMPYLGSASFPLERMPYCGLVSSSGTNNSNPSDTDDDDDDEDNSSRSSEPSVDYYSAWGSSGSNNTTTSSSNNSTRWIAKLLQISNVASALCVLDCTVLPVLMVALPMTTGIFFVTTTANDDDHNGGAAAAAAAEAAQEWLHALGHRMALCFVLPVGLLTTSLNFVLQHGNARILALGLVGLCLILAANADAASCHDDGHENHHHHPHDHSHEHHHHFHWHWFRHDHDHQLSHHHHHGGQDSSLWLFSDPLPYYVAQLWALVTNHHGIAHRITNVLGCTLMFASNYLSRKKHAGCSDPNCKW